MLDKLKNIISKYITLYSNRKDWRDVRRNYGIYSYIAFLSLAVRYLDKDADYTCVEKVDVKYHLSDKVVLNYLLNYPGVNHLISDVFNAFDKNCEYDINNLYQLYLACDFMVTDDEVIFVSGKNGRDMLGSYYTQEEFAYKITKKAILEYMKVNTKKKKIKIADFSCGGGVFLSAGKRICEELGMEAEIYGYDVDPIAVMISRVRLQKEDKLNNHHLKIVLGNPLLNEDDNVTLLEMFEEAIVGRFYSPILGKKATKNMDVIVGNPPWEKIRFEEKKFFHHYCPTDIASTKSEREIIYEKLSLENRSFYNSLCDDYKMAKEQIKQSDVYNFTAVGELNTYALFTELAEKKLSYKGIAGLIIKTSLLKLPVYSKFFESLVYNKNLREVFMFINRRKIFPIDSREEFSVIYIQECNSADLLVALNLDSINNFELENKIQVSYEVLKKLNPDTGMFPNIKNQSELEFLIRIYKKNPTFDKVFHECKFGRLVHLTNHSNVIHKNEGEDTIPVYEGKFIEQYTGKYATFHGMTESEKYKNKASALQIEDLDGEEYPVSRFHIEKEAWKYISKNFDETYIVAWRSLTSSTNKRTMLATILPKIPTCQSIQLLQLKERREMLMVLAIFNSVIFDYLVRLKMAGLDLTQTIIKQIPIPDKKNFKEKIEFQGITASIEKHINSRICALYKKDDRLIELFENIESYAICKNRKTLIAEIDKLMAIMYGIDKKELKVIASSFSKYYSTEEIDKYF